MKDNQADQDVIYHLVTERDFHSLTKDNVYVPALFAQDGFIHCTGEPATLLSVANDYFADVVEAVLVLVIEVDRVAAEVKFEPPAPISGGGTSHVQEGLLFPHIYGPLNLDAVAGVGVLRQEDRQFCWPEDFVSVAEYIQATRNHLPL
jgi:uncharacterized protein (DUF952 family)